MQICKKFEGTITDIEPSKTYDLFVNYGVNTKTAVKGVGSASAAYETPTTAITKLVYNFLKNDCGVDDVKTSFTYNGTSVSGSILCLVVFGAPITFVAEVNASTSYNMLLKIGLPNGNGFESTSNTTIILGPTVTGSPKQFDYNFSLVFTGNPKSAFILRLMPYNSNSTSSYTLFVAKSTNLVLNKRSVVFSYAVPSSGKLPNVRYGNLLDSTSVLDTSTYDYNSTITFSPVFETTEDDATLMSNRIPLIHQTAKFMSLDDVYLTPRNFGLPIPNTASNISQVEFKVGNRKFIQTANSTGSSGSNTVSVPLGVGLIDVSNDPD